MHKARNWVRWIFPFSELRRERSWETRRERSHGFPRGCHNRCTWAYKWMLEMNALSWQSKQSLAATLHMLKWTQIGAKCTFASLAFQISSQRKSERASELLFSSFLRWEKQNVRCAEVRQHFISKLSLSNCNWANSISRSFKFEFVLSASLDIDYIFRRT